MMYIWTNGYIYIYVYIHKYLYIYINIRSRSPVGYRQGTKIDNKHKKRQQAPHTTHLTPATPLWPEGRAPEASSGEEVQPFDTGGIVWDMPKVHPWKLTCPPKMDYFSREYIFQPLIFRGHVSFQGSKLFFSGFHTHVHRCFTHLYSY